MLADRGGSLALLWRDNYLPRNDRCRDDLMLHVWSKPGAKIGDAILRQRSIMRFSRVSPTENHAEALHESVASRQWLV